MDVKLLAEISDQSLGFTNLSPVGTLFTLRKSARAIVIDNDQKIASQQETVWVDISQAKTLITAATRPSEAFIKARESAFLNEFFITIQHISA